MHGYLGHVYGGQVSIIHGISLASSKGVEVDLGYDCFDRQIYLMCGYLGHVYSGQVSIISGYHEASLRFCLGDKPNFLFQEGSLVTFMEASTFSVVELMPSLEINGLELLWWPDPQDYIEGYLTIYFFTPIGRCTIEVANPYIHSIDSCV
nr:hypothetical protein CFP56_46590 [Quercus suber]